MPAIAASQAPTPELLPPWSAEKTATAAVIPIRNWPTLNAILSGAMRLADCPAIAPAAIARVSTPGRTRRSEAANGASVREKFSRSSPCGISIQNCSRTATAVASAAHAITSWPDHRRASGRRTATITAPPKATAAIRRSADGGRPERVALISIPAARTPGLGRPRLRVEAYPRGCRPVAEIPPERAPERCAPGLRVPRLAEHVHLAGHRRRAVSGDV